MQSLEDFARGTEHIEDRAHLAARLARGDRLRIKFGVDPTAPDLHLGHTVPMRRLRAWQRAGHLAVIVIGDWTARIGDPSGRSQTRPPLQAEEVEANAQTYLAQLFTVLDRSATEVRRQSEWFDPMGLADVLRLCAGRTVQQLLQRADFTERIAGGHAIGLHELLYPMLQGYDSVAVAADVEIGGTDQLFNLLAARDVQRWYGMAEQDVATFPLLEGLDGVRKMSKSYGNYVGVTEPADEQFGKVMSIPDSLIVRWLRLVTDVPDDEVARVEAALGDGTLNPRDAKAMLAAAVVRQFHGEEAAETAAQRFSAVFSRGAVPDDAPVAAVRTGAWDSLDLVRTALAATGQSRSGGEVRRLLQAGAATLTRPDGVERLEAGSSVSIDGGEVLRVGRRIFVRLVAAP